MSSVTKSFEVAVIDPISHNSPLDEQLEMVRTYAAAGIRIWLTDQTLNWWPEGLIADSEIGQRWQHAFWDRYAQVGYLAALVPEAEWAIAVDVVRRRPDVLAQTMLTLHEFTRGKILFALASGEAKQLAPYGYDGSKQFTRLEESIQVIKKIWSGEKFSFEGQTLQIRNAQQTLQSWNRTTPPLSTIGLSPRLRRIAAEQCEYVMVQGSQHEVRGQIESYREEAAKVGRDPESLKFWGSARRDSTKSGRWFSYEDESEIALLKKSPMAKFSTLGGWIPSKNSPFGENYHYAKDLVPTEWDKERVMSVLDKVPDEEFHAGAVFFNEDDIADWIVSSVEVGIDIVRFSDRTPEILPSRLPTYPAYMVRAYEKAKKHFGQA